MKTKADVLNVMNDILADLEKTKELALKMVQYINETDMSKKKINYVTTGWKDVQSGTSQTYDDMLEYYNHDVNGEPFGDGSVYTEDE